MIRHPLRQLGRIVTAGALLLASAVHGFGEETVIITNRVIYPGETISADALEAVTLRNGAQNNTVVASAETDVEGKVAKRTLLPGRMIPLSSVRDAYIVESGASVQVVFLSGPLIISASGVTLQPGSAGDLIKVRNMDSGKVVSGTVMADGSIRISAT
ncbi:flagellar basal body P-ring formation chaperone FlgA [Mesorhizobium sp. SB112]|uniref:flagellar basal body P-ring formation chaperone FlgA n=1 Tax=Mesorhizobium sp. SB112 TaxID=3151853 RepID=UPI0032658CC9